MTTLKMRTICKMLLFGSLALMLVALILSVFVNIMIPAVMAALVVLAVFAFLILSRIFWRCPRCGLHFRLYDMETEQNGVCPRCKAPLDDPTVTADPAASVPSEDEDDDEDDEDGE